MINDNIKRYRKEKGYSQEEMAVKLHVVRQTVSKWENGRSVPDAEVLIRMAEVLDVSVNDLLGIEIERDDVKDLTSELARVNEVLAEKNRQENLVKRASEKRGLILFLSFASMLAVLGIKNPVVSVVLSGGCILAAVFILYRNLALMTSVTTDDMRLKVLKITTIFNIGILMAGIILAALTAAGVLRFSEQEEKMTAMFIVACIMVFMGIVSPKLPFTRHTGLRLPWTIRDQETWNLAHRVLGYISLPLALLYVACSLTMESFQQITLVTVLLWIGIPGGISYIFYWRKMHGNVLP
nr:XRE family transcriptional regulator [uncultured Anaerostipes sp.]